MLVYLLLKLKSQACTQGHLKGLVGADALRLVAVEIVFDHRFGKKADFRSEMEVHSETCSYRPLETFHVAADDCIGAKKAILVGDRILGLGAYVRIDGEIVFTHKVHEEVNRDSDILNGMIEITRCDREPLSEDAAERAGQKRIVDTCAQCDPVGKLKSCAEPDFKRNSERRLAGLRNSALGI